MQSKPLLSVIVPFYNTAHYFSLLLQSIEVQLLDKVQVVLVCDGATDGSLELAQQHIKNSATPQRYLVLQQQNSGVSVARNKGIQHASGDYIGFIDADDLVLPGYFSTILAVIQQHKPDLIELGYQRFTDTADLAHAKRRYLHKSAGWQHKDKAVTEVFVRNQWFPCLRVYRKNMALDFQFPAGVAFCEDMMAIPTLYQRAQQLYHLRLPLYGYREHQASISFNIKTEHQRHLEHFFTQVQQHQLYPAMPQKWRHILLFNLAYLIYKLQLNTQNQKSFSAELKQQFKLLLQQFWWSSRFSVRKKLKLAFACVFFKTNSTWG